MPPLSDNTLAGFSGSPWEAVVAHQKNLDLTEVYLWERLREDLGFDTNGLRLLAAFLNLEFAGLRLVPDEMVARNAAGAPVIATVQDVSNLVDRRLP